VAADAGVHPGNLLATLAPWLELRRMHAAVWTAVLAATRPRHRAAARELPAAEFG
jgi:hypothetical protein